MAAWEFTAAQPVKSDRLSPSPGELYPRKNSFNIADISDKLLLSCSKIAFRYFFPEKLSVITVAE